MAALTAARAGAEVILADEAARMGGQLLSDTGLIDGKPISDWTQSVLAELAALPNVRLMPRTTVTGAYDGGTYGALERVGLHLPAYPSLPRECFWRIVAGQAILASGALERGIAFADNDRPGIMTASAIRTYLNHFGVAAGHNITIFANNDSARQTARDLMAEGIKVAAIIDNRADASVDEDCPVYAGAVVTGTKGRHALREITVLHRGSEMTIETDCLGVSGGCMRLALRRVFLRLRAVWPRGRMRRFWR
jgi:sarcosine oxidase subunit alpha